MKRNLSLLLAAVVSAASASAQVVITSLNQNGQLTWTNAVTNATYRVEWASSAAGPWTNFNALTKLDSIWSTNNRVTVQVPMLYRVVWVDAPAYFGLYDYQGYNLAGDLVVTGRLSLTGQVGSSSVSGTRDLYLVGSPTNEVGTQLGFGRVSGNHDAADSSLWIDLNSQVIDDNVFLSGTLIGNTFLGMWMWDYFGGFAEGTFRATNVTGAAHLPAPVPIGVWDYTAMSGNVRGEISFSTGTNPVAGSWTFEKSYPTPPTGHVVGQGTFTNAALSGNTLTLSIEAAPGESFTLEGQMAGDNYAGFWRRTTATGTEQREFFAHRRNP